MTISEQQKIYSERLSTIYSPGETKSIIRLVFEKVLQANALHLSLDRFRILTTDQTDKLNKILQRLLTHEPVQYVLGEADFCGLKFKVNNEVLIPRPETEELVQWITGLQIADRGLRILDVCSGSGCIAISLAKRFPNAIIEGCDISDGALEVARENNSLNQTNVNFFKLDILKEQLPENTYDLMVSNPPYITQGERNTIEANVLEYEPHLALFAPAGNDLIFYSEIGSKAIRALKGGGQLFFEINEFKGAEVIDLLRRTGFKEVTLRKDINQTDRMVQALKP